MPTLRFQIGEAFSASDPVARFITVLGMMSNDWLRLARQLIEIEDWHQDSDGLRVMAFRQQAGLHHEAAEFLVTAGKRFSEVREFVNSLDEDVLMLHEQVVGGVDPKSEHYHGDWLEDQRNVTFHYPEMHPEKAANGAEEISEALQAARGLEGTISTDGKFGDVRFDFADDVAAQWLPDRDDEEVVARLRDGAMALAKFVQLAAHAYLKARPDGMIRLEP